MYEGCTKSVYLYLVALSRDIFERHTMRDSKEYFHAVLFRFV